VLFIYSIIFVGELCLNCKRWLWVWMWFCFIWNKEYYITQKIKRIFWRIWCWLYN